MTVLEQIKRFSAQYGKSITVNGMPWHYHRLGAGAGVPLLWLTGGLRRAGFNFAFLEQVAENRIVIAPDYPPIQTVAEFNAGLDAILQAEGAQSFALGGTSYGGLLAQVYLAHRGSAVERLVITSSGANVIGKAWLPLEYLVITLARVLPEKTVKGMLTKELLKVIATRPEERAEWEAALEDIMQNQLTRADVISHFALAADWISKSTVSPAAFSAWHGPVIVLSSPSDPTQRPSDFPKYEQLFGRPVQVIDMGSIGHTPMLFNPQRFTTWLEQALG